MNIKALTVPNGWEKTTVGQAFNICNSLRKPISSDERKKIKGQFPYYGPTGILDHIDHYRAEGEYALIGEDGDHFLKYANRPMTLLVKGKFNVNNHAHLIQGKAKSRTEWFHYFFMHTSIKPYLTRQGAGRFKLNKSALEKLPILLPPLSEQDKIAEILGTWDEAIALEERLIAALQTRKKGLMQRLLTGKVRFPGFVKSTSFQESSIGLLPADWKVVKQSQVARFINGRAYKKSEWEKEGTPVIRLQNLTGTGKEFYYSNLELPEDKYANNGDLLYMWSATFGPRIWEGPKSIYHYHIWKVVCSDSIQKMYLYYLLSYLTEKWQANSHGMGILHITKGTMEALKIPLPTLSEQIKIAELLKNFDNEIQFHKQKLTALQTQKKGLMQRLLTGQVRVSV